MTSSRTCLSLRAARLLKQLSWWRASKIPKQLTWLSGNIGPIGLKLHERYGDVVRIAPNELSYIRAPAWRDIFGRPVKSEMPKVASSLGEQEDGVYNLATAPTEDHTRMRRIFTHSFSNTALAAQEPLLVQYADKMIAKMGETNRQEGQVDVVDFFNFTTFDIMAELAFGESLGMLERTDYVPWVRIILAGLKYAVFYAAILEVPLLRLPLQWLTASTLKAKAKQHAEFAASLVNKRLEDSSHNKPDLWSFVLKHNEAGRGLTLKEMHANASMFMVAGSETTATTLSGVIYYVCKNPHVYNVLVNEIRTTFATSEAITPEPLAGMQYLNAVLKETLRLYFPGGGGMSRVVPAGGAVICGDFVPAGTTATMNHYIAYLNSTNFSSPKTFIPERWTESDDPRFAFDQRDVHQPFSYGARNCIGKNLAWLELRLILAKTLWHYDAELLPEKKPWIDQRSFLVWEKGPLMVRLHPVKRAEQSA
ncbi:hypothetical protein PFICI_14941 [Pestalotiopsis fici W106-1]|uniref:Isotrichodermin C-15 hydroxylase n=1 Tax=Pestalotiopsis fici (strain W106-1 / CGMCC3.15140) TaxID=1229662 RepID=W3WKJ6_PESFW|nr:uncharacterized protein PFICI_14941 [Pestalotiopsis fici W106-1]ETS73336.1 hypothetical protein PFICI_14941 [Pestalotiopsis fici W106-1]